jgi:hypothetical protein
MKTVKYKYLRSLPGTLLLLSVLVLGGASRRDAPGPGRVYCRIQFVNALPDYKVQIVGSHPDFTIQWVDAFPGVC